jgi:NADH-quinone oxidoreductase subunit C/D
MDNYSGLTDELTSEFGGSVFTQQLTVDEITTLWVAKENLTRVLNYLKHTIHNPFELLYDLCAIDERSHAKKNGSPLSDFTIVYHLLSLNEIFLSALK